MKNFRALAYLMYFSTVILFLSSCSKDIEPETIKPTESIEKRCANLCENLVYYYEDVLYEDSCCLTIVYAYFENGCPSPPTVISDGNNIPPSGMDGQYHTYYIEHCDSQKVTISGDDGVCEILDLECGNCCADIGLTATFLSQEKKCCTYRINVNNPTNCQMYLFGLDSGPFLIDVSQNVSIVVTVCGEPKTFSVGTSIDDICTSEKISCGCKEVMEANILSSDSDPESDCCTYQLSFSNFENCTALIYDDNGNILGTIPPMTSSLLSIDVCPSDGFLLNINFGCSLNKNCNTIALPLLCTEGD